MPKNYKDIEKLWDKNIDDILSKQSKERREDNERCIEYIRDLLSLSETGKALLDWADKNNIRILVDNQTEAGGYYCEGLNTIAISSRRLAICSVATLAHEIRHAWQDAEGFLPHLGDEAKPEMTVQDYIKKAWLCEADAFAIGSVVEYEIKQKLSELEGRETTFLNSWPEFSKAIEKSIKDDKDALKNGKAFATVFEHFFEHRSLLELYENRSLAIYADKLGIKDINIPLSNTEYDIDDTVVAPASKGIKYTNKKQLKKLGKVADLTNYHRHLSEEFHKHSYYGDKFTTTKMRERDYIFLCIGGRYNMSSRLLMKYVKHKQKKMGIK